MIRKFRKGGCISNKSQNVYIKMDSIWMGGRGRLICSLQDEKSRITNANQEANKK